MSFEVMVEVLVELELDSCRLLVLVYDEKFEILEEKSELKFNVDNFFLFRNIEVDYFCLGWLNLYIPAHRYLLIEY